MRHCELSRIGRCLAFSALALAGWALPCEGQPRALKVAIGSDGRYSVGYAGASGFALTSGIAAEVDGVWLRAADYPKHSAQRSNTDGYLGTATEWRITWSGQVGAPDLVCRLRTYDNAPFADIQVEVENTAGRTIHVQAIRAVDAEARNVIDLDGPAAQDRVLSDSFSEDRPAVKIRDLADARGQLHRAVGSQLIYNRQSHESLFVGALASDKFLTILRLHLRSGAGVDPQIASYEVESTGTTEMEKENSLEHSPAEDQIPLSLPVEAGGTISSEPVLISADDDYHHQLETYGSLIGKIHHARTSSPPLMGWWSWTAFYFGLNEGAALTNAQWEAQHLKPYGYDVFHIDEGYQYARGEYTSPDATLFPHGMSALEYRIRGLGLTPAIWTAPFEVSDRSWVFRHHEDWLVKNAKGEPIPAGHVTDNKDQLYMLDTTNPGAADYLRFTYSTMVHEWGIHYFKLDFMDDSAIEGFRYKPDTTALEAQRIGLQIIRSAVGDNVYLDKDGSVMLNPVGYVDYGRISQDTGHTFEATKDAATGIAARYYMNRNFFVSDPDALAVSTQTISDQHWHEGRTAATLDEAEASIALAAVSGGMLEIGDNLPSLENAPERLDLIENQDLIDMVRLGRASIPIDLMDYANTDQQPSIFFLQESPRQSILTVFNWTEQDADRTIQFSRLGLSAESHYAITDVFAKKQITPLRAGAVILSVPARSARVLRLVNSDQPVTAPIVAIECPGSGMAGETIACSAEWTGGDPAIAWDWDFGDGVTTEGRRTTHAWTEPGDYKIRLTARGLSGKDAIQEAAVHVTGHMPTVFDPASNRRLP